VAFTQIHPGGDNVIADIYSEENLDSGLYAYYDQ
jgi:hypothetical protein